MSFFSSLFSWLSDGSTCYVSDATDATISSSRFITRPIVNAVVNKLAFIPPVRDQQELSMLKNMSNHFFATDNEYAISYMVCKPALPKAYIRKKYGSEKTCILFSHGNASDVLQLVYFCDGWANLFGIDCICYDYIGYGLSEPTESPTEEGCYRSIRIMMNEISKKYDKIYLIGQSLGTGICVDYCSENNWLQPIVLISPYKSIVRVVANSCMSSAIDSSFNTIDKLPKLKCPVKIFHGEEDNLIGIDHGMEIYENLPDKTLRPTWFAKCGHNNILERISFIDLDEVFTFWLFNSNNK